MSPMLPLALLCLLLLQSPAAMGLKRRHVDALGASHARHHDAAHPKLQQVAGGTQPRQQKQPRQQQQKQQLQQQQQLPTWQCDYSWYFYLNGTASPPPGPFAWKSTAATSQFQPGPCLMISGIHVIQTFRKSVLIIDRSDANNSYFGLPNGRGTAYAEELTLETYSKTAAKRGGSQRPLDVKTNTFCSTGATDQNGNVLSIGGSYGSGSTSGGFYSVRQFAPCSDATCDFTVAASLTTKRWYPTAQLLGDGRMLIVGGSNDSVYMAYPNVNNPTVEYYSPGRKVQGSFYLDLLSRTAPYNLYPFVHLLPSGKVFIFAAQSYILFSTSTNAEIYGKYPSLSVNDPSGFPIYRSYPVSGMSALFPMTSANNYLAEIMICGGSSSKAAPQNRQLADPTVVADSSCWRISPEAASPAWTKDKMCKDPPQCTRAAPRVMGDAVLLPQGSILIMNGAEQGYQSIPNAANVPALQPIMYSTQSRTWYMTPLAVSRIPRGYHSSANLLHDGTVFVSGSNPNQPSSLSMPKFPSEFRTEIFSPPYLYGAAQPTLQTVPTSAKINTQFKVQFAAYQTVSTPFNKRFLGVLVYPGISTHGHRHGMRNVNLVLQSWSSQGNNVNATFSAPPSLNICPPSVYWFFILDSGIPCKEALPLKITP